MNSIDCKQNAINQLDCITFLNETLNPLEIHNGIPDIYISMKFII